MADCRDTCCRPEQETADVVIFAKRDVRARKQHTCRDCGGKIEPGQVYVRTAGLYDGDLFVDKSHTGYGFCVPYEDDAANLAAIEREERETYTGATS